MIAFLLKVWGLARPYRGRLFLGVLTGVISGFIEPLMIATIAFVYALIFPSKSAPGLSATLNGAPTLIKAWLAAAQDSLRTGVSGNRGAVVALVGVIPAGIFLRGLFSYLNIYYLQWAAVRAITDLRVRLFDHLMKKNHRRNYSHERYD